MFKVLDLKYTLSDLKVVSASPEEAQVSFVQKTEKLDDRRSPRSQFGECSKAWTSCGRTTGEMEDL